MADIIKCFVPWIDKLAANFQSQLPTGKQRSSGQEWVDRQAMMTRGRDAIRFLRTIGRSELARKK